MALTKLLNVERRELGVRGGKGDLYLGAHRAREILGLVADEYRIPYDDMLAHKEHVSSPLAFAALAAGVYALRNLTALSLPRIAETVGYEHHSSVTHALKQVARKRERSKDYANELAELLKQIYNALNEEST